MRGGAGGKDIPFNLLLQSTPEFESASNAKPIITQKHTSTIENMIKLFVLGEDWDAVITCAITEVGSRRGKDEAPDICE